MIPGSFEYHRRANLSETVALLAELDSEARVIAGGHSLIPMMKLRLAMPSHLIDLAGIAELKGARLEGGEIVIGAMTTQPRSSRANCSPNTRRSARSGGTDPRVRYVGTIGGNVANGDPGNDMPAVMIALAATYVLGGASGERRVAARDYSLPPTRRRPSPARSSPRSVFPLPPRVMAGHMKS